VRLRREEGMWPGRLVVDHADPAVDRFQVGAPPQPPLAVAAPPSFAIITFPDDAPRRVRYLQLRLHQPSSDQPGFSIRDIQAIGPCWGDDDDEPTEDDADDAAQQSIVDFFNADDDEEDEDDQTHEKTPDNETDESPAPVEVKPPPPPPGNPVHSSGFRALQRQMELNRQAATELPRPPRFDPPPSPMHLI
jgi:hypothetical protein